ncbi:hypothetical protein RZS28_10620 [Methylocapsa polymorpha]|uniref:Phosphate transport regulator n=1 Tax=Methylocapsa polymorpha TaxID=3080828 RepID=A0ABZ0HNG6_9HYPH|nr:hypothetical protein RZS28_10620 [Methylocapsa sp. RX1]
MKAQIIEQLGQSEILLPSLVADGLAANNRVKVRMSALQAAAQRARDPAEAPIDLSAECEAAGLGLAAIKSLIAGARQAAAGRIAIPDLPKLTAGVLEDVKIMLRAVEVGAPPEGKTLAERLVAIEASGALAPAEEIEAAAISRLTSVSATGGDSLHRLVMDLHKALNRLAATCAEEILAGAHVHGLRAEDRPAVEAFMRGLNRTKPLKFGHPGLATTAARSGSRLIIQNDIGTTDAHVIVLGIEGDSVTVTHTDVHLVRAKFFTGLFDKFPVRWSGLETKKAEGPDADGAFYLVTGRFAAESAETRDAFLEAIGAALVFLIDWNKARKVLRLWVSKGDAIGILDWAARNSIGHRAFLELGGADLVASAVRHAIPTRIGFGERLDSSLGRESAVDFLKTVLRVSTDALLEGQSVRLVRDRIEADLVRRLERVESMLLAIVVRQAGLAREIAAALSLNIADRQSGRRTDGPAMAALARRIEEKADRIAVEARNEVARFEADATIEDLVNGVEAAIDELEQAAFIASLVPAEVDAALLKPLAELCAAAVAGTEAAASGIVAAAEAPEGRRADSEDALAAVARLIDVEHIADAAERAVTAQVLRGGLDLTTSLSVLELARAIERATDRLAGFGHRLRQHVLADLAA